MRTRRGVRWPLAAALVGVCCSLVLLPETASSEHDEPPGEGYVWVATPEQYSEQQLPLDGVHYDWWRCSDTSGCTYGLTSYPHGTTRTRNCGIPGGSGRVGLGHCGAVNMCPAGDFGDCFGDHVEAGGWSQVLGPHNPNPGRYDSSLCVAADNQEDVGALSPPTPGHYDCWPVPGTWDYRARCGGEALAERGREHCGHWRAATATTTTTTAPTATTTTAPTATTTTPTATTTTAPTATTTTTPTATTTTIPTSTTAPPPQECVRSGFVWFSEYGGCRPEDCSAVDDDYVRNLDDGWCGPDCTWDPTDADRAALAARVGWHSFLEALPQGPPGERWPPHPEVPGGDRHIVVANSPIWPRIATARALDVDDGAGCVWSARWLRATVTQMLPWVPGHRAAVEAHGGLAQWLGMWDRLSASQRAQARARHVDGDLASVACPVAAAADGAVPAARNLSYQQCRWELARPGAWHWILDAGYTDGIRNFTDTLAEGITWFRSFDRYTNQQTFTGTG